MEGGLTPASEAFKEMIIIGGVVLIAVILAVWVIAWMINRNRRY